MRVSWARAQGTFKLPAKGLCLAIQLEVVATTPAKTGAPEVPHVGQKSLTQRLGSLGKKEHAGESQ
jgi:hypothetical protein